MINIFTDVRAFLSSTKSDCPSRKREEKFFFFSIQLYSRVRAVMEAIVSNTIGSFAALAGLRVRERERERESCSLIRPVSGDNVCRSKGVLRYFCLCDTLNKMVTKLFFMLVHFFFSLSLSLLVVPGDSSPFGSLHDFPSLGHDHQRSHDGPLVDADAG